MIGKRPLPCPEEATVGLRSEGWVAVSQGRKEGGGKSTLGRTDQQREEEGEIGLPSGDPEWSQHAEWQGRNN